MQRYNDITTASESTIRTSLVDDLSSAVKQLEQVAGEARSLVDVLVGSRPEVDKDPARISGSAVFDLVRTDAARVRELAMSISGSLDRVRGAL